jgi:hypothetical protein
MASAGYEKLKRHRLRQRQGRIVLQIEIDYFAVADLLVAANFLAEWDTGDRNALRRALEEAIATWAEA